MRYCIFAGTQPGTKIAYRRAADDLGRLLARRGIGIVYGGGSSGLMGAIADAALDEGGSVIGIIPDFLTKAEQPHPALTELRVVETMHQRKAIMAQLSDGFIALPGGIGTLEEILEMLTWKQLGRHNNPLGLLNCDDYYTPLTTMLDHAVNQGFLKSEDRDALHIATDPAKLIAAFAPTLVATP